MSNKLCGNNQTTLNLTRDHYDDKDPTMPEKLTEADICELFPLIVEIEDEKFRLGVIEILIEIGEEMAWNSFLDIPKNIAYERHRTLVAHVNGVTQMALDLAKTCKENLGLDYDRDMLLAACLLHDGSKPVENEPDPDATASPGVAVLPSRKSELGKLLPHGTYIAHKVLEKGMGERLAHLLITHTHASNVRGKGWEAALLFYADFVDTDAGIVMAGEGAPMYSQRWKLGQASEH